MSETIDARPALRPDAFVHPNSPRRFDLAITPPTPVPTRADALHPSFWSDINVRPRDIVAIDCSDGRLDVLVNRKTVNGWIVRPL